MTSPDRLLSAMRAALDDTERLACAAAETAGETWWHRPTLVSYDDIIDDDVKLDVRDGERLRVGEFDDDMVAHIARHDPATVLRLVTAMREICAAYELALTSPTPEFSSFIRGQDDGYRQAYGDIARALARGLGIDPEETG